MPVSAQYCKGAGCGHYEAGFCKYFGQSIRIDAIRSCPRAPDQSDHQDDPEDETPTSGPSI